MLLNCFVYNKNVSYLIFIKGLIMSQSFKSPRWMRDLNRYLNSKPQFVLSGNIHDRQQSKIDTDTIISETLVLSIYRILKNAKFNHVLLWNSDSGFEEIQTPDLPAIEGDILFKRLRLNAVHKKDSAKINHLSNTLDQLVSYDEQPVALIIDYESHLSKNRHNMSFSEHQLFARSLALSQLEYPKPRGSSDQLCINTIIWLVEKESNLPDWLLINNPKIRHIPVTTSSYASRKTINDE